MFHVHGVGAGGQFASDTVDTVEIAGAQEAGLDGSQAGLNVVFGFEVMIALAVVLAGRRYVPRVTSKLALTGESLETIILRHPAYGGGAAGILGGLAIALAGAEGIGKLAILGGVANLPEIFWLVWSPVFSALSEDPSRRDNETN